MHKAVSQDSQTKQYVNDQTTKLYGYVIGRIKDQTTKLCMAAVQQNIKALTGDM